MADIKVTNNTPGTVVPKTGASGVASLVMPNDQKPAVRVTDGIKPAPPPPPPPPPVPKKPSSSPWDEDVPETPAKTVPTTIGNLHEQEALELPKKVEEKVGQKIPATQFIGNQADKDAIAMMQNSNPEDWDWFGGEGQPKNQALAAPNTEKINLNAVPPATPPPLVAPLGQPQNMAGDIKKPVAVAQAGAPVPVVNQPASLGQPTMPPPPAPIPSPPAPSGPFSIFTRLFRRKETAAATLPQTPSLPIAEQSTSRLKKIVLGAVGLVVVLVILIMMTEMGIVSLKLENVYGAIGLEKLWGGLPPDAEQALAYSFSNTKNHPNYKIKGTMNLRIDSSVKSDIVSPLVSMVEKSQYALRDKSIGPTILATKTASDTYIISDPTSTTSSSSSSSTDSSTSTSTSGTPGNTTSTDTSTSSTITTTTTLQSTVLDLETNVALKSTTSGTQAKISFKKDEIDEELDLVNIGQNLFVKGTTDVNFGSTDPAEFVKYQIQSLEDKSIGQDIFDIKTSSGLTIKGARVGNEVASGVRCYKYQLDSVEIGSALTGLGITADYVQTATGQIWIGIRDKTIRQAKLKITTPISSAVTMIDLDIQFYDYDVINRLDYENEITNAVAPMAPSVVSALSGDTKRKADADAILAALTQYKTANGSYPVSGELLKLNTSGNIIETALVPTYLAALPTDPTADWYYAYKSANGQQCSLSARLESSTDASGQLINGVYLYLKYSN